MAKSLRGAEVTAALNEQIRARAAALAAKGILPTLGILRVGERPDDVAYERSTEKRCEKLGIAVKHVLLPADADQESLIAAIRALNEDETVHGVLMFRPLPKQLDEEAACRALAPAKDVDGITAGSLAGVFTGEKTGFAPCTAQACVEILEHYGIPCSGRRAVVVGRSLVVGKPAAMLLLAKNATVTICHTKTADLAERCREADILIAAAGRPQMIGAEFLRAGQTVIDVGIHVTEDGSLCGDVKTAEAESVADAVTPVPGGVGTVTTSVLAAHVVEAAERQTK